MDACPVSAEASSPAALVTSAALVGTGLRKLLLFYRKRPEARRAATKFGLVWHGGDVALLVASMQRLEPEDFYGAHVARWPELIDIAFRRWLDAADDAVDRDPTTKNLDRGSFS